MTTDVFLSHDWGKDTEGRDNHKRVAYINDLLKKGGITTWFDSEKMTGNIVDKMCQGIDNAKVIVVFITSRYCDKVSGENESDNCKMEFNYSVRRRGVPNMVPVVMESKMKNTQDWSGPCGMALGGTLYVDLSADKKKISVESLIDEIKKRKDNPEQPVNDGPDAEQTSDHHGKGWLPVPDKGIALLMYLKAAKNMVRIKKSSGVGAGYYLVAYADKRNADSTWALVHGQKPDDQDELWNIIPWTEGKSYCFKIEKAKKQNKHRMLTGHSDKKANGDIRTLVHNVNDVPDECWDLVLHGDGFKIVKALNQNKDMSLVCTEKRNGESFWVDLSDSNEDNVWIIEPLMLSKNALGTYKAIGTSKLQSLKQKSIKIVTGK